MEYLNRQSIYGAFNARWISPADVALTFVPIPQFSKLLQRRHSLLLGPRGCGKTTMLKMLSREAQMVWRDHRVREEPELASKYPPPDFEAVYIPSDRRWAYEIKSITAEVPDEQPLLRQIQRVLVSLGTQLAVVHVFRLLLADRPELQQDLAVQLVKQWGYRDVVPTFSDIRLHLLGEATRIRGALMTRDAEELRRIQRSAPPCFYAHPLDGPMLSIAAFAEIVPKDLQPRQWALCFDELEIAPPWLKGDLLESLRSTDQDFLLKLTWTPVLPEELAGDAEAQADYDAIRIWHSHVSDAVAFAEEFSTRLIRSRLSDRDLTPREVFGSSEFAAEERLGYGNEAYARQSPIWQAFVALAARDASFREYLTEQGISPEDPISDGTREQDLVLRSAKAIALLRETFRETGGVPSRKRIALYSGVECIYAMSDGNPRWLAGLLNELLDTADGRHVPTTQQARVLSAASRRQMAAIKAFPSTSEDGTPRHPELRLDILIPRLARFMRRQILGDVFVAEPIGSYIVDDGISKSLIDEVEMGLSLGSLIYIGDSPLDVPRRARGSRLRLSFMFSPGQHLPFRNYRAIALSSVLKREQDPRQLSLLPDQGRRDDEIDRDL